MLSSKMSESAKIALMLVPSPPPSRGPSRPRLRRRSTHVRVRLGWFWNQVCETFSRSETVSTGVLLNWAVSTYFSRKLSLRQKRLLSKFTSNLSSDMISFS